VPGPSGCVVDVDGLRFAAADDGPCDVLLDGRRIWSTSARRGGKAADGRILVPWPRALAGYLKGVGQITVRDHASGAVHFDGEVRFDASNSRVGLVDSGGHPLTVTKWGGLDRSFDDAGDARRQVELTAELLRDLNERAGIPAFAAYGTLLGAVRGGKVIGHDFDTDVAYLSSHSHPGDIVRESFALQRALRALDWPVHRVGGGKLRVDRLRSIDIFVSYFVGDRFYLDRWVEGSLHRDQILPMGHVVIEGCELPAPADAEALLELTYGPGWRVPDPTFRYDNSPAKVNRARGWFGPINEHAMAWENHWQRAAPDHRSVAPFARWVAPRADRANPVFDVGCGLGIDTMHFAAAGLTAIGLDFALETLLQARNCAAAMVDPRPTFERVSLADTRQVLAFATRMAATPVGKTLYSRLLLDALPLDGYQNFWRLLRLAMARGGQAYLEFRAEPGVPMDGTSPRLWRRVPAVAEVMARIADAGGSVAEHRVVPAGAESGAATAMRRVVADWPRS
jgi:SAM-dependent methyltransferase